MTFEVLVEELRAAAAEHRTIADKLGTQPVEMTEEKPDTVGHVELALWMNAVGDQIVKPIELFTMVKTSWATASPPQPPTTNAPTNR